MNFLTLTKVSKIFANTAAVEDFNLDIEKGELVSFLGNSIRDHGVDQLAGHYPKLGDVPLFGKLYRDLLVIHWFLGLGHDIIDTIVQIHVAPSSR